MKILTNSVFGRNHKKRDGAWLFRFFIYDSAIAFGVELF